jgi:stearoyl-CoA desaturase (delta-9 desaturase)
MKHTTGSAAPDDVEPVSNVRHVRIITAIVTAVPILSLFFVAWQLWDDLLGWNDVFVFLLLYVLTGLGVTVGFYRLFTHRAFKTSRWIRAALAILSSAAIEGPVIAWVADHRKHHPFSDREGDPHSPHVDHGQGWRGAIRGLVHPHVGWLFIHTHRVASHALRAGPARRPGPAMGRRDVPGVGARPAARPRSGSAGCSAAGCATA